MITRRLSTQFHRSTLFKKLIFENSVLQFVGKNCTVAYISNTVPA